MTGPGLGEWAGAFEAVVDGFGLSANAAMNKAILQDQREGLPADFPAPLYALALACGAVAAGAQKAAEFAKAVAPYVDEEGVRDLLIMTVAEHWIQKMTTPEAGVH